MSQAYDSPCSVAGLVSWLRAVHRVPRALGRALVRTVFPDCIETSARWTEASVFARDIPTGIITSTRDAISPAGDIEEMVRNWDCTRASRLVTDSEHLRSLRDAPETYAGFCRAVGRRGLTRPPTRGGGSVGS